MQNEIHNGILPMLKVQIKIFLLFCLFQNQCLNFSSSAIFYTHTHTSFSLYYKIKFHGLYPKGSMIGNEEKAIIPFLLSYSPLHCNKYCSEGQPPSFRNNFSRVQGATTEKAHKTFDAHVIQVNTLCRYQIKNSIELEYF